MTPSEAALGVPGSPGAGTVTLGLEEGTTQGLSLSMLVLETGRERGGQAQGGAHHGLLPAHTAGSGESVCSHSPL